MLNVISPFFSISFFFAFFQPRIFRPRTTVLWFQFGFRFAFRWPFRVPSCRARAVQPDHGKMWIETVIWMDIQILDGHHRSLFKRLIWKETWSLTMEDFDLHSDDNFRSHFSGIGLYKNVKNVSRLFRISTYWGTTTKFHRDTPWRIFGNASELHRGMGPIHEWKRVVSYGVGNGGGWLVSNTIYVYIYTTHVYTQISPDVIYVWVYMYLNDMYVFVDMARARPQGSCVMLPNCTSGGVDY